MEEVVVGDLPRFPNPVEVGIGNERCLPLARMLGTFGMMRDRLQSEGIGNPADTMKPHPTFYPILHFPLIPPFRLDVGWISNKLVRIDGWLKICQQVASSDNLIVCANLKVIELINDQRVEGRERGAQGFGWIFEVLERGLSSKWVDMAKAKTDLFKKIRNYNLDPISDT